MVCRSKDNGTIRLSPHSFRLASSFRHQCFQSNKKSLPLVFLKWGNNIGSKPKTKHAHICCRFFITMLTHARIQCPMHMISVFVWGTFPKETARKNRPLRTIILISWGCSACSRNPNALVSFLKRDYILLPR